MFRTIIKRNYHSKPAKGNGFVGCTLMIVWISLYLTGALKKARVQKRAYV